MGLTARTVSEIEQSIIDAKNADSTLSGLNSTSATALWRLWAYVIALCQNLHEQLWEVFQSEIEADIKVAVPGTAGWLQDQVLKFQYSISNPQIIQLIDWFPEYPTVDSSLRIVTQCAITQTGRVVNIKVAKGVSPSFTPLDSGELLALQSYINKIKFAGIQTNTISLISDKLMVGVDIYFDGQYVQANVKADVISAIQNYLASLPFDGTVNIQKLQDAIQSVSGVIDLVLKDVTGRADSIPLTSPFASFLVVNSQELAKSYQTSAGYIIPETTSGSTLSDTVNMILG